MKKRFLPFAAALALAACGNTDDATLPEENDTEVSAPEDPEELDPTGTDAIDDTVAVTCEELVNGTIEVGTPVSLTGTVEELTDDNAFLAFIFTDDNGENRIFVRNMAEVNVSAGDIVSIEGIFEGTGPEDRPEVAATVINQ